MGFGSVVSWTIHLWCPCGNLIALPLAIPPEKIRAQIPWPAGSLSENFRCPVCTQATAYSIGPRTLQGPSQMQGASPLTDGLAVIQFSAPCEEKTCSGRVEIHEVLPRDFVIHDGKARLRKTEICDLPCTQDGHINNGTRTDTKPIDCAVDCEWEQVQTLALK